MNKHHRPVALLAGGSSGLGQQLAIELASHYHLVLIASSKARLEATDDLIQSRHHEPATLVPLDLHEHDQIDAMMAGLWQRFGRLDLLVGLAATIVDASPLSHIPPEKMQKMFQVNTLAHYRLIRSADALLRQADHGRMVMITGKMQSIDGENNAYTAGFDASKIALQTLCTQYAQELYQSTLKTITVDPRAFESKLRRQIFPGQRIGSLPSAHQKAQVLAQIILGEDFENGQHYLI